VVEHDSVVEKTKLGVWEVQVVAGFLREFFPVADCVVGDVADCAAYKSESTVGNDFAFDEVFDCV